MDTNIASLLGVTEQQFELIRTIELAALNGSSKPKDIEQAYKKLTGKLIQKPNLFAQLRDLQKRDLISKTDEGYVVQKPKLKEALLKRKHNLAEEINKCDALAKELDKLFKSDTAHVAVRFVAREEAMKNSIEMLRLGGTFLRNSHIPAITYSEVLQKLSNREEFDRAMKEGCQKGILQVKYVVSLDPKRIFIKAYSWLKDKGRAYREVETCYKNLVELIKMPNIEFHYFAPSIESFYLLEDKFRNILFLPLRASSHQLTSMMLIENKDICETYREAFYEIYQKAIPLTESLAKKLIAQKLKHLRESMDDLITNAKAVPDF